MISVAAEGYGRATVAEVVRRARVSRSAFYEHFADKDDCFLIACETGTELMFQRIAAAVHELAPHVSAAERSRVSVHAYLQFLMDEPEFAACFLVAAFAAGPGAITQLAAVQSRFAENERRWHERARRERPTLVEVPPEVHSAIVGAIHQLVVEYVRTGRASELLAVEDIAVRLHEAVYSGWAASGPSSP